MASNISFVKLLDLYKIMVVIHIWGTAWANTNICFFTDNESVVQVINKHTCGAYIMALLRPLVLACLRFYINFDYGISARCKIGISRKKNAVVT